MGDLPFFNPLNPVGSTIDIVKAALPHQTPSARMDAIKALAHKGVQEGTIGPQSQIHGLDPIANGMRAGATQALFGIPDVGGAISLALNPNSPTHGNFFDSLDLAHAITNAQAERAPISSLAAALPIAIGTGSELTKGANAVATGLADAAQNAPRAVKAGTNLLKAATEFRPAQGPGAEPNFLARLAGNIGSGIAQGTVLGGLQAYGTGNDVAGGAEGGALGGGLGAALPEVGGTLWRSLPWARTSTAAEAIPRLVQEDPATLAQRYRDAADAAGQQDVPLQSILNRDDARRVYEHALNASPETRVITRKGVQAYMEAQPEQVARVLNRANAFTPAPAASEAGPGFIHDPTITGPQVNEQYMRDSRDAQMRAALAPHEATPLDTSSLKSLDPLATDELRRMIRVNRGIDIPAGHDPLDTTLTVSDADSLRKLAATASSNAARAGNIPTANVYQEISNALQSNLADQVPEYGPAYARWKAQTDVIDGYNHGLAGRPVDENLSPLEAANLRTQEGQYGYRLGATERLRQSVKTPEAAARVAADLARDPHGPEFGDKNQLESLYGGNVGDMTRERLGAQTKLTEALAESTRTHSPTAPDQPSQGIAEKAALAQSLTGHPSPWSLARLTGIFSSQGIGQKAARELSQAILDPNSSDAMLAALAKKHPNLGLTAHAMRFLSNRVMSDADVAHQRLQEESAAAPAAPADNTPASANPFDQFDTPASSAQPEASPSTGSNPFDQFDTAQGAFLEPASYTMPGPAQGGEGDPGASQRYADFLSQFGTVTSTRRSAAHNRAVGGVPTSMHLTGQAVDFVPRAGIDRRALVAALKQAGPFTEVLDEGNHIHVGWRQKGNRRGKAA